MMMMVGLLGTKKYVPVRDCAFLADFAFCYLGPFGSVPEVNWSRI